MSDQEEENDEVVNLHDIVNDVDKAEAIVMGGINSRETCSYEQGYMKRQALYVCKTCKEEKNNRAALCFACASICHHEHEIHELYTKRNFRCECGTAKFGPQAKCQVYECGGEKSDGLENKYDQNFDLLYCTCHRPYPDPERSEPEEMHQCILCEDWFHEEHLNLPKDIKIPENYEELVCSDCVAAHPFLMIYSRISNELKRTRENENSEEKNDSGPSAAKRTRCLPSRGDCSPDDCYLVKATEFLLLPFKHKEDMTFSDIFKDNQCHGVFFDVNWRENLLCCCKDCVQMYKREKVDFLLDKEDTMVHYLEVGRKRIEELDKTEAAALRQLLTELPRPMAVDIASGIAKFKSALAEFMAIKRDENHVVTAAEVRNFFNNLNMPSDVKRNV